VKQFTVLKNNFSSVRVVTLQFSSNELKSSSDQFTCSFGSKPNFAHP